MDNDTIATLLCKLAALSSMDEVSKRLRIIGNAVDDIRFERPPLKEWMIAEIITETEIVLSVLKTIRAIRISNV